MAPDDQPLGDPPPGFRYRVVEIPLDQVFSDSTMTMPYSTESVTASGYSSGSQGAYDEYDKLLEEIIRQHLRESPQMSPELREQILQQEQAKWQAAAAAGAPPPLVEGFPPSHGVVTPAAAPPPWPEAPPAAGEVLTPVMSVEGVKEEEEMKEMIREMHEEQESLAAMLISLLPAFLLLLLFIPIGIFLFVSHESVTLVECPFHSCVDDAQRLDDIMEHASVSACVDFYEHTCAYWREKNPVPDYAWRHSYLDHMRMNIEADIRDALKAESQRRARTITTGLVTTMIDIYRGCTTRQNSEKGRKAMYDLDVGMFRGNQPLAKALSQLVLQFDIDGFFRVRFLRSEFSYPKEYLELDFPSLLIRPENLLQRGSVLKEADKRLLYEATVEVYDALRIHTKAERRTYAERVVDLVKAVAVRILNLKPTAVDHPVAYRRVSDFMGSRVMDWYTFFSEVTHHSMPHLAFVVVKLVNRHYLLDINQFFDSLSGPSGDTTHFMDYLRLLLFLNFATALPSLPKVTEAYWRFAHDFRQEPERWRLCLYFMDDILPRSLSWFYHHYHLTLRVAKEGNIEEHLQTVTALKDVFAMLLANTNAAPFNMRVDGAIKLEKMNVVMFFVPGLVQGDAIQIPPPTIDVDSSNIVPAALAARRVEVSAYYNFSNFVERGEQFGPPYKVLDLNCRYNYGTNTLYIPHALFHGPLFKEGERNLVYLPKLLHVIGMGMGKALDPHGIHISSEPEDSDWLWGESLQHWENNTACFRTIYNVLDPKTRRQLDPIRTFPGNLVDSMALQAALWYFRRRAREVAHPNPDFHLPKTRNLSSDELFFYSFGEYMCEVLKPAAHNKVIDFGYLPPNRIRLNTLLRNTPEFAAAFNCPSTSEMVLPTANYCMAFPRRENYVIRPIDAYTTLGPSIAP